MNVLSKHTLLLNNYKTYLTKNFPCILSFIIKDELFLIIDNKFIKNLMFFLKHHTLGQFKTLNDIVGTDYPQKKNRFEITYILTSIVYNTRLNILTFVDEITPVYSVSSLFKSATWSEREVWDMFGVYFYDNLDLRRILTDYGFKGHPLRKDFPLTGYVEARYDVFEKRVILEKLSLNQQFRNFNFDQNWLN